MKKFCLSIVLFLSMMLFACNEIPQNILPPDNNDDNIPPHEYEALLGDLTNTIWVSGELILSFSDNSRATLYAFENGACVCSANNFIDVKFDKKTGYANISTYTANSFFIKNSTLNHEFIRANNVLVKPMVATISPNKVINTFCALKDGTIWLGGAKDESGDYNSFQYFDDALAEKSTLAGDIIFSYPKDITQFSVSFSDGDNTLQKMQLHNYLSDDWYNEECQLPTLADTATKRFVGWSDGINTIKDTLSLINLLKTTKSDCVFSPVYKYNNLLSSLNSSFWVSDEKILSFDNENTASLYVFNNDAFEVKKNNFVNISFSENVGYTNIVPTSSNSFTLQIENIKYKFSRADDVTIKPLIVTSARDKTFNSFCALKNGSIWLHGIQDGEKSHKYYGDLQASDATLNSEKLYAYPNNLNFYSATFQDKDNNQIYDKVNLHNYLPTSWYNENIIIPSPSNTSIKEYNGWKTGETLIPNDDIIASIMTLYADCIFYASYFYKDVLSPFDRSLWVSGENILSFNNAKKGDLYVFSDKAFEYNKTVLSNCVFDRTSGYSGISSYTENSFSINLAQNVVEFTRAENVALKPMQVTIARNTVIPSWCALKNNNMWLGNVKYNNTTYDNLKYFSDILAADKTLAGKTIYAYPSDIKTYNLRYTYENTDLFVPQLLHAYLSDAWLVENVQLHADLPTKDDMAFLGWQIDNVDIADQGNIIAIIKKNTLCNNIEVIANYIKINPFIGSYFGSMNIDGISYNVSMVITYNTVVFTSNNDCKITFTLLKHAGNNITIIDNSDELKQEITISIVNNSCGIENAIIFEKLNIIGTTDFDVLELVKSAK